MPDSPNDLVPRVAVLEQLAKDTREALARIERRFDVTDARIDKLGAELRGEIAGVRAETAKLGTELRGETAKLGAELRGEIAGVRAETAKLGTELRGEISGVRGEISGVRGEINGVRSEVASVRSIQWTTFLWLLALLIGTFGSLLGVMAKGFRWL